MIPIALSGSYGESELRPMRSEATWHERNLESPRIARLLDPRLILPKRDDAAYRVDRAEIHF